MALIRFKRGTRAELEAAAGSDELVEGEPYYITDEPGVVAIGTGADSYADIGGGGGGPVVTYDDDWSPIWQGFDAWDTDSAILVTYEYEDHRVLHFATVITSDSAPMVYSGIRLYIPYNGFLLSGYWQVQAAAFTPCQYGGLLTQWSDNQVEAQFANGGGDLGFINIGSMFHEKQVRFSGVWLAPKT